MAHAADIVAYMYQADLYCAGCIDDIAQEALETHGPRGYIMMSTEQLLNRWAARVKICREDEATFDSGDFPKVVLRDQLDGDEHCGNCHCKLEDE